MMLQKRHDGLIDLLVQDTGFLLKRQKAFGIFQRLGQLRPVQLASNGGSQQLGQGHVKGFVSHCQRGSLQIFQQSGALLTDDVGQDRLFRRVILVQCADADASNFGHVVCRQCLQSTAFQNMSGRLQNGLNRRLGARLFGCLSWVDLCLLHCRLNAS